MDAAKPAQDRAADEASAHPGARAPRRRPAASRRRSRTISAGPASSGSSWSRTSSSTLLGVLFFPRSRGSSSAGTPRRLRWLAVGRDAVAHRHRCSAVNVLAVELDDPAAAVGDDPRPDRVPALAAPLRVPRARSSCSRSSRIRSALSIGAAAAVRRDDPRRVERLLDAVAAGRGARGDARRDGVHARRSRAGTATARNGSIGVDPRRRRASRGCTWPSTSRPAPRSARSSASPSALTAFRWFAPNDVFPVTYRRGKAAHLDVGGRARRGDRARRQGPARARRARRSSPSGLEGSGGSTPLRLTVGDARRRARPLRVREALREEPRARRPLVQARPHDPVRRARGRDAVRHRPPVRRVRGLHAAPDGRRRPPDAEAVRRSSRSRPSAST